MGDFIIHEPYSRPRTFLSLFGWFLILSALLDMDDPYGRIGDELISRYPITWHVRFLKELLVLRWSSLFLSF